MQEGNDLSIEESLAESCTSDYVQGQVIRRKFDLTFSEKYFIILLISILEQASVISNCQDTFGST